MTPPPRAHMDTLDNERHRTDILNRLKRAEGQLRGIQRMVEQGEDCQAIAMQMAAVRKALDSTYVRMTMCFMEQKLHGVIQDGPAEGEGLDAVLQDIETLLGKVR